MVVSIGIDLGTTNSCVAVSRNGKIEIIPNNRGERITPSIISIVDGIISIGKDAAAHKFRKPENVIYGIKYLIGRNFRDTHVQNKIKSWPFGIISDHENIKIQMNTGKEAELYTPEALSGLLLKELKKNAEEYLGQEINKAVITVPTYFEDSSRQATIDAGKIAGFKEIELIDEPTAAAIAYGIENSLSGNKKILVFDFGGGTFDVSILEYKNNKYNVIAIDGDIHLGGDDIDNNLIKYCLDKMGRMEESNAKRNKLRLKEICEKAKKELSTTSTTDIEIINMGDDVEFELTLEEFNRINSSIFQGCIDTVEKCLKKGNLKKEDLTAVLLIGGSTRNQAINIKLQEYFGMSAKQNINRDEAVAIGAAILASKYAGEDYEDLKINPITAYSLGIKLADGSFSIIIPKFTEIPTKSTEKYYTNPIGNPKTNITIYSGENKSAVKNKKLGDFMVDGVVDMPPNRTQIKVTFEIDQNAILKATAVDQRGKSTHLTVKLDKGNLSQHEIEECTQQVERKVEESEKKKRQQVPI